MSAYPKFGTAPIRCGRSKCNWRGFETDLSKTHHIGGIGMTTHHCPQCGCDSYSYMTPRQIQAWERQRIAHGETSELRQSFGIRVFEVNDSEWWIGDGTPEEILRAVWAAYGFESKQEIDDVDSLPPVISMARLSKPWVNLDNMPRALSDEELDRMIFVDDSAGIECTYRKRMEQMIKTGQKFPCLFAILDY